MKPTKEQERELYDYLAGRLIAPTACDGTLRRSRTWSEKEALEWSPLEKWLRERGGCCDCEVLLNLAAPFWSAEPEP